MEFVKTKGMAAVWWIVISGHNATTPAKPLSLPRRKGTNPHLTESWFSC